jgi:ATP synthase protein I
MRLARTSLLPALAVVAVCVVVAWVSVGGEGALGAALGGVLVCGLFLANPVALGPVTKVMPQASIGVALLFFGTKVLLVLALLTALLDPDGFGASVDAHAVVLTVIAMTIAWMVLLVRDHARARMLIYDLPDET